MSSSILNDNRDVKRLDSQGNPSFSVIGEIDLITAKEQRVTNLVIGSTSTEFSHALQDGLKQLILRSREKATIQFTFVSGETATKFISLRPGAVLTLDNIDFTSKTIYMESNATTVVEILELT